MGIRSCRLGTAASRLLLCLAILFPLSADAVQYLPDVMIGTDSAAPAAPARNGWTEQNPCPDCAQAKRSADYFADRLARIELEIQATRETLDANTRKRLQAAHRIDDVHTRFDDEPGTGGESYDPHTGITVRSHTQSDGTVKVDTLDPDGRLVDSYRYPRRSTRQLLDELPAREAEVKAAEQEDERLQKQLDAATQARGKAEADLEQARRVLRDCVAARCLR
jgi:septal ring factor EnvC (AmiA/AmiB activator)